MTIISAAQVANEILLQGGSIEQAWVGAALVSGVESNGDPTELSGGIGPAAGLFQFEPGTWAGNGGTKYAAVAQDATWQQQVTVFLNASQGNNFHDWGPDLVANSGNPNDPSNAAYGYSGPPQQGSRVGNTIASLAQNSAIISLLGQPPAKWPTTATLTSDTTGGGSTGQSTPTCTPVIGEGGILGIGSATLLNSCQAQEIVGVLLMATGAVVMVVGLGLILAEVGLSSRPGALVTGFVGGRVTRKTPSPVVVEDVRPAGSSDTGNIPDSAFDSAPGTGRSGASESAMNRERLKRRPDGSIGPGFPGDPDA